MLQICMIFLLTYTDFGLELGVLEMAAKLCVKGALSVLHKNVFNMNRVPTLVNNCTGYNRLRAISPFRGNV